LIAARRAPTIRVCVRTGELLRVKSTWAKFNVVLSIDRGDLRIGLRICCSMCEAKADRRQLAAAHKRRGDPVGLRAGGSPRDAAKAV
jgi:hypothetical protein